MNTSKLRWILYLIVVVIASTIAIQVYWNYKNYLANKQQFINDIKVSLDTAVDNYYQNLTKKNTLGFILDEENQRNVFTDDGRMTTIIKHLDIEDNGALKWDKINPEHLKGVTVVKGLKADSLKKSKPKAQNNFNLSTEKGKLEFKRFTDSVKKLKKKTNVKNDNRFSELEFLTSQVIFSVTNDSLNVSEVDSLFKVELDLKKIDLTHNLVYKAPEKWPLGFKSKTEIDTLNSKFSVASKSLLLPESSSLKVNYQNENTVILKRMFGGILISTLLVLAVISSLFYLLKIINQQKQLAEVKNDLISNITHEFKTPIATIGVALESIKDFNVIDDKAKTEKYIDMSSSQLSKLNVMVEKLLETATLDSENLNLNKESIDLVNLIDVLVEKHQLQTQDKTLKFRASTEDLHANVDVFHFENALNNIIDNAIKYGGDAIEISVENFNSEIKINVSDNGNKLTKQQASQIFEKFYRVPKGNTHDVKGFGIGLYYTKKIIEKHNGNISVALNNGTTFKISIPNE